MPHGLEYVVRPYQSTDVHGAIIIPSSPAATRERATLSWGAKATLPSTQPQGVKIICCNETLGEIDRQTETVRIYQPGKPENYVDVNRAYKVQLNKKEKDSCAGDWDQFSGVGQKIADAFAEMAAQMDFDVPSDANCQSTWNLKNNTSGLT